MDWEPYDKFSWWLAWRRQRDASHKFRLFCLDFWQTGYSCFDSYSSQLMAKCTLVGVLSRWWLADRIFPLVIKSSSQDIEQDKWHNRDEKLWPFLEGRGSIKPIKHYKFTGVAKPKKLALHISPDNINLEKRKRAVTNVTSNRSCRQRSGRLTW